MRPARASFLLAATLSTLAAGCDDGGVSPTSTTGGGQGGAGLGGAGGAGGAPADDYDWGLPVGFPRPKIPADNPMSAVKVELGRRLF